MSLIIELNNIKAKFLSPPPPEVVDAFRLTLRYKVEGAQFMKSKWVNKGNRPLSEYKYLFDKRNNSFPTGLLYEVEEILKKFKISYTIRDTRPEYPIKNPIDLKTYKLRDYQLKAEKEALKHKNCVIRIATGGGKTAIFTSILGKLNGYKNVVIVRRQLLLVQTIQVLEEQLGVEVGQIGAGVVDIKPLTVAMVPTVARALDPKYKFSKRDDEDDEDDSTDLTEQQKKEIRQYIELVHCVIADEVHGIAAESAQLIMNSASNARYKQGYSATPWRTDGKDILINAVTGEKVVNIDASYLIKRGYLVTPHIHFLKSPPCNVPIPMQGDYQKVYKTYIVENDARNDMIFKVVEQAWNRCEHILILVHQIAHGEELLKRFEEAGMWAEYISGSSSILQRQETIDRFSKKIRAILIGTSILDEGVDIPEITTLINAGGGKSSARYYQKIGRAIRLCEDKTRAMVIDFLDQDIRYMKKHAQERLRIVRTEALYKIKVQGEE